MSDSDYFTQRSLQERIAAETAPNPDIGAVHARMADLYAAAAKRADTQVEAPLHLFRRVG